MIRGLRMSLITNCTFTLSTPHEDLLLVYVARAKYAAEILWCRRSHPTYCLATRAAAAGGIDGGSGKISTALETQDQPSGATADNTHTVKPTPFNTNSSEGNNTNKSVSPRTPMKQNPEKDSPRWKDLEALLQEYRLDLQAVGNTLQAQGLTPDQITAAESTDKANITCIQTYLDGGKLSSTCQTFLVTQGIIPQVTPDGSVAPSPDADPNAQPMFDSNQAGWHAALHAMLEATATLWGMPEIAPMMPVEFRGVSKLFSVKMWPWVVRHKIDMSGFTTTLELHAYGTSSGTAHAPGTSIGKQTPEPLLDFKWQVDYKTGNYTVVGVPTDAYDKIRQSYGMTDTPPSNKLPTADPDPVAYPAFPIPLNR